MIILANPHPTPQHLIELGPLLALLDGVRTTGGDRWLCKCPSHEDRSPSLSVRETSDGTILLKCFAGCSALEVVHALGLELKDLFPAPMPNAGPRRHALRIPARDLLELLSHETSVIEIFVADLLKRRTATEADWQRLAEAVTRIHRARDETYGR